jgi:hypothetical protein
MLKNLRLRLPSPAMIIALIALIVAMGGTGYAAIHLPKNSVGSKQIKKNAVTGSKITNNSVTGSKIKNNAVTGSKVKDHSLTGADIHLAALGTVPNATNAGTANNATNAGTANNANNLGGQPPSAFAANDRLRSSDGVIKLTGTASGNEQTMFTFGPFTVTLTCTKNASNQVGASLDASSSEDNSVINQQLLSPAGTTTNLATVGPSTTFAVTANANYDFEAPSGAGLLIAAATGINSLGTDCWFNYMGVH